MQQPSSASAKSSSPDEIEAAEQELADRCASFAHDPLGYVLWAYDWGHGELAKATGPRQWQAEVLDELGAALRQGEALVEALPILLARASGHGIGKSALIAWLADWAMATMPDSKVVVTANTEQQLRTKTWPEICKWFRLSVAKHWWTIAATSISCADEHRGKTWRLDAVTWSENNTEAFAGLHNLGKRIVLLFDEASAIADRVWEVAEGAMTDEGTEIIWCAFGNPTRNSGRFKQCFGSLAHRWLHKQIDSRSVPGTNKAKIDQWIADYGEDSDFVRVRVRGVFPRAGSTQLIPSDFITAARKREAVSTMYDPLIMAIDVARFGDDQSVIRFRRGRDARSIPALKFRGMDTMQLAARAGALITQHMPDAVFVDGGGVGGGVVDRLRQLRHDMIWDVQFGAKADTYPGGEKAANKAAEMWMKTREWLKTGGAIDDNNDLAADLESREYGYNPDSEVQLEKKSDMKKRGLASPDDGDALALTFAHDVAKRLPPEIRLRQQIEQQRTGGGGDYDPYANI